MFTHRKIVWFYKIFWLLVSQITAINHKYNEQVRFCAAKIDHGNYGQQMKNIDKVRAISGDESQKQKAQADCDKTQDQAKEEEYDDDEGGIEFVWSDYQNDGNGSFEDATSGESEANDLTATSLSEKYTAASISNDYVTSKLYDETCICDEQIRIIIILDETSSMKRNIEVTIEKFNQFLSNQKNLNITSEKLPPKLTLVKFSSTFSIQRVDSIYDFKNLSKANYSPSGSTALYDAIGCSINAYNKENNNILVIITDGAENSSNIFTKMQIKKLTKKMEQERGWLIQYLGANQDSFVLAGGIGITNSRNFRSNADGFTEIFNKLHEDISLNRESQFLEKAKLIAKKMRENRKIYRKIRKSKGLGFWCNEFLGPVLVTK